MRTMSTKPVRGGGLIMAYCTCLQYKIEGGQRMPSDGISALSVRAQAGHARLAFTLFKIDIGFLYDLTPAGVIPFQDGCELRWRGSKRFDVLGLHLLDQVLGRKGFNQSVIQLLLYVGRHACRRNDRPP